MNLFGRTYDRKGGAVSVREVKCDVEGGGSVGCGYTDDLAVQPSKEYTDTASSAKGSSLKGFVNDMETVDTFRDDVSAPPGLHPSNLGCDLLGDMDLDVAHTLDEELERELESAARHDTATSTYFRDADNNSIRNITDVLSFDKRLGQGVYGDVFLCHLRADRTKRFAVKRIQQAPSPIEKIFGLDQNIIKELHALRALKRPHANIVRLYDFCSAMEPVVPRHPNKGESKSSKRKCVAFYLIFELCDMDLNQFVKDASMKYKAHEMDLFSSTSEHTEGEYNIEDIINQWCTLYLKQRKDDSFKESGPGRSIRGEKIPLPGLPEDVVKVIMYQMLQGLAYIHSNRIIHRDIKPQNILLKRTSGLLESPDALTSPHAWQVKIGDLGLSTIVPARYLASMTEEVVTLLYRPPELLLGDCKYTTAVDIWSTAASVGECLLGKPMFRARTEFSVLMRIVCTVGIANMEEMPEFAKQLKYLTHSLPKIERDSRSSLRKMFTDHFGRQLISEVGLDLFVNMLQFVPEKRITAEQALRHPWFDDIDSLLKPSIARSYHSVERVFPKGQRDMLPLPFKGDLCEFQRQVRKANLKESSIDEPYMQFVFP
ncbi:Cyclin-dependent kinase B2-2 [Babesia sp. Xinjiang]|uniref:Cyclin-dependent kinase B2-2 n=1 Tax=Babesia sp. Xinjiang TaxID=462227 RepID=UPI000A239909|nr:Cyclin-dependent kinase B2-2 [Babesia sp. Xinjiang]ORM41909.1 Cyclin-dependent kinase B2-2 [Babesia sp. Xinjiang]